MILPLKLRGVISYSIPEVLIDKIVVGRWVIVSLKSKKYYAVVERIGELEQQIDPEMVIDIEAVVDSLPLVSCSEIAFHRSIAEYYLCTVGEVLKAAYPSSFFQQVEKVRKVKRRQKTYSSKESITRLSDLQQTALNEILESFKVNKNVLLRGVTGSGKTELYIKLALEALSKGGNVLYLVPEIALSRQLEERLGEVFGAKLLVWHSKRTASAKKEIFDKIKGCEEPYIVLGTRSSVLLPMENISLIVVDEEHDASYKQDDPAPRYNARDVALMIAAVQGANVVLGSATPSLESIYNAQNGKLTIVELPVKYYSAPETEISIIDMRKVSRMKNAKGSFSMKLINEITDTLAAGKQVMVFRSRRSYASLVQCTSCGEIPKCPHCNVSLSYHKFNNVLSCHYCGYKRKYSDVCSSCSSEGLKLIGAGTEKLEEELKEYFPNAVIARLDADIATSKSAEERTLQNFAKGEIDILVGTQMISKGFDFPNLALVAVINADSILSVQDFRADERGVQLLKQLAGRTGRREQSGKFIIQTFQPYHKVFSLLNDSESSTLIQESLEERSEFEFPPFVRLVEVSVRDFDMSRLEKLCVEIEKIINNLGIKDYFGPLTPQIDKIRGRNVMVFWIKLPRTTKAQQLKKHLATEIDILRNTYRPIPEIVIDVDPK